LVNVLICYLNAPHLVQAKKASFLPQDQIDISELEMIKNEKK